MRPCKLLTQWYEGRGSTKTKIILTGCNESKLSSTKSTECTNTKKTISKDIRLKRISRSTWKSYRLKSSYRSKLTNKRLRVHVSMHLPLTEDWCQPATDSIKCETVMRKTHYITSTENWSPTQNASTATTVKNAWSKKIKKNNQRKNKGTSKCEIQFLPSMSTLKEKNRLQRE